MDGTVLRTIILLCIFTKCISQTLAPTDATMTTSGQNITTSQRVTPPGSTASVNTTRSTERTPDQQSSVGTPPAEGSTSTGFTTGQTLASTGCAGPSLLCCPGRNNSCFAAAGCFCDEICLTLGDCCSDYVSSCNQTNATMTTSGQNTTTSEQDTPPDMQKTHVYLKLKVHTSSRENQSALHTSLSNVSSPSSSRPRCPHHQAAEVSAVPCGVWMSKAPVLLILIGPHRRRFRPGFDPHFSMFPPFFQIIKKPPPLLPVHIGLQIPTWSLKHDAQSSEFQVTGNSLLVLINPVFHSFD
uniref:SMB domain-containing protein n=1 Tax=Knipowitschia caucasica TaxID=637954 RepID=A0AAV2JWP1_KNICA